MTHFIELDEQTMDKIEDGQIAFLLKKDDRPYKEGDKLLIQDEALTGRELPLIITSVVRDEPKGLMKNYCIVSFRSVE